MSEPAGATPLRRTWLRGYRPSDVEIALARARLAAERLEHELGASRSRTTAMQVEIDELHRRLEALHRHERELQQTLAAEQRRREELAREARTRGDDVLAEAERRASGMRTEALRHVAELQEQVEQLLALRAGLTESLRSAGEGIGRLLEQVEEPPPAVRPAEELAARLARLTREQPRP